MPKGLRAMLPLLLTMLLALAAPPLAQALDASVPLRDLNRVSWGDKENAPTDVYVMAQTRDGWLWLGTQSGLYKFDGVRFYRQPLPKNRIHHLHASDNGDLLISYLIGGLSILHADGRRDDIDSPVAAQGVLVAMERDADGTIWAISLSQVYRYRNGQWKQMDSSAEPCLRIRDTLQDQYGRIWVGGDSGVYLVDREREKVQRVNGVEGGMLTQSPDGQIWTNNRDRTSAVPMPPVAQPLPRRAGFNQAKSRWAGQFDREGNFWVKRCPQGMCRIRPQQIPADRVIYPARHATERLDQYWQLSSTTVNEILEDREGNIWVATATGLDRFRENKLRPVPIPSPEGVFSMAADADGQLWVTDFNTDAVWTVSADGVPQRDPRRSASVLANDRDGALLLAGTRSIERLHHGVSSHIPLPLLNGVASDLNVFGLLDDGKILWMGSQQTGVMGLVDGEWRPRSAFNLPPAITTSAPGQHGRLWLGQRNGTLHLYDNGKLSQFDIGAVGPETALFPGTPMVVAGERGIAVQRGQRFELLGAADVDPLRNVSGMTITPDGDRWFNGSKGVVRVRKADWEAALRAPAQALKYELIDVLEGYVGRAALTLRLPTAIQAGAGRIWLLGGDKLLLLDTGKLQPSAIRPATHIMALHSGGNSYISPAAAPAPTPSVPTALTLPPDSRSLSIDYSTPGLRKPEGMRFQYRLDGADSDWVDAGMRRTAYYTNIGPGNYLFQVRAITEDGVSSAAPATLTFAVQPTVWQTWWFRLLCVAALLGVGLALHRYRLRLATAQAARQAEARTDERERIARTLHDSFLQSIYALILQVYALVLKLPEGSQSRLGLSAILDLANSTIDEGRAQLQRLRGNYDAEQLLQRIGDTMAAVHSGTSFQLSARGERRRLSAATQEEISGIGQEALHNAFQHAQASQVTVQFDYGSDYLTLRISDNGQGLDQAQARQRELDGHWGLVGMRERAARAGGQLSIDSRPGAGVTVTCRIAAALAYATIRAAP